MARLVLSPRNANSWTAAEDLADAVEDYAFTTEGSKDAMRNRWQRYVDLAAQVDDESSR